jgi:hypothetical protein
MVILTFPNLDVLRLALTSGAIPAAIGLAPARAAIGGAGETMVEPSISLDKTALHALRRLGVGVAPSSDATLDVTVVCWPQLLPLEPDAGKDAALDNVPVLFEIADELKMPELVGEILRLGNDRQSFRWVETAGARRALVRVIGPPYYSLLRALDNPDRGGTIAYRECKPRVWAQLGWKHSLAEQIQAPPGQMLLMRRPRSWSFVEEGRFRDIYEVLDFALPAESSACREIEPAARIQVPVRLAPGGSSDPPELWVIREDGPAQIDSLVRNADDELIARLAFAAAEKDGQTTIVLRVRPSKTMPPVVVLKAIGFRPYLRLANLFLPAGRRLHPPLRRDAVAGLLARDVNRVTWLYPEADGRFTPESLAENAFRPLSQWVDYVLDRDHVALTAWVDAHRFDFEHFVCADDKPPDKRPDPKKRTPGTEDGDASDDVAKKEGTLQVTDKSRARKKQDKPLEALAPIEPGQLEKELIELETQFAALKTPLDSPQRQALWPQLARRYAAVGNMDDAGICAGNALWELEAPNSEEWMSECRERDPAWAACQKKGLAAILKADELRTSEVRFMVMSLLGGASNEVVPHLGLIQQQLEKHEAVLGVRLAWLAWEGLHRLAHGDVLALARARDRLLERLYLTGLSADLDLPGFLRVSGAMSNERYRRVRDHMQRMRPMAQKWIGTGVVIAPDTGPYVDLMFAYAFAQLGEATLCHDLVRESQQKLTRRDDVNNWLTAAFEFRISEALDGRRGASRFPEHMLETLEITDRLPRYKIDRLREHSRILEPHEKIDPYRRWHGRFADDLSRELALLFDMHDRAKLADRLKQLLSGKTKSRRPEPRVLATALELAPRLGESFAADLLYQVERGLGTVTEAVDVAMLIEKSLFLAAHYDKKDEVQDLVGRFHSFLGGKGSSLPTNNLETLLGASFRGLRKLGLRDEAAKLLERMAAVIQERKSAQAKNHDEQGKELRLLLQVAAGWFYFDDVEPARVILDAARTALFDESLPPVAQTQLACAYSTALGQAPLDLSMPRILELFRKLTSVQDAFTTNSHYSLSRLDVIEAAILALVSEDFKVSPEARRWLEDDEFLVRRRIHRTMRVAMGTAGL